MGWKKKLNKIKRLANRAVRITAGAFTAGGTEALGLGKKIESGLEDVQSVAGLETRKEEKAKKQAAAQAAAAEQQAQKDAADRYKASILGQRAQRLEDALSSQTDFTGDEEKDPRELITRPEVSKKKKLIGF
nr:MAG TPA: hypothetical protein [Caudoviricetes sp.]